MQLFARAQHRVVLTSLMTLLTMTSRGTGDVYTSTNRIVEMAVSEDALLDGLSEYISNEENRLRGVSKFLSDRTKAYHQSTKQELRRLAEHPNGAYFIIKSFNQHWTPLFKKHPDLIDTLVDFALPTQKDVNGAMLSLIRLQRVYRLAPQDMYAGNYLGVQGLPLEPIDSFLLGRQAFMDGYLKECVGWLELAIKLLNSQGTFPARVSVSGETLPAVTLGQTASLLGRAYVYMNNITKGQEMYDLSYKLEPTAGDVTALKNELNAKHRDYKEPKAPWEKNFTALCLREKHHIVAKMLPLHVCRYKMAFGRSYLTFKEEILSIQPYASLFYDVVTDQEIDSITEHIKGKMFRGMVGQGDQAKEDNVRTGDLGWIHDVEMTTASTISRRVKVITGLDTDQRGPDGPSSAEAMQVVNYGLGGHYGAHTDPFDTAPAEDVLLNRSGTRIATFLIYLSDVEKGGNTVFIKAGISVPPRKGMALFWYNFTPAMEEDLLTEHAGCPVLVGQKWIANKWIWTYGNTFRRPCGPSPDSHQMDVEKMLAV